MRVSSIAGSLALRLRMGAPVNLGDWSLARKRLYDTNVFRQVDIEPVPMEPTAQDSAAGIQPIRAVVRVVEYPVWRLRYGTQFSDEEFDTIGGLVLSKFGRLPKRGEEAIIDGLRFKVLRADSRRLHALLVEKLKPVE